MCWLWTKIPQLDHVHCMHCLALYAGSQQLRSRCWPVGDWKCLPHCFRMRHRTIWSCRWVNPSNLNRAVAENLWLLLSRYNKTWVAHDEGTENLVVQAEMHMRALWHLTSTWTCYLVVYFYMHFSLVCILTLVTGVHTETLHSLMHIRITNFIMFYFVM